MTDSARGGLEATRKIQRQFTQKRPKVLKLLGTGPLVHAEQRGLLKPFQKLRGRHIGNQHALFNQFVCVVALHRLDRLRSCAAHQKEYASPGCRNQAPRVAHAHLRRTCIKPMQPV